jgi:hypothetical protein
LLSTRSYRYANRLLKTLILTFSPGEKEPLHLKMPSASFLSHSLPLGETHGASGSEGSFSTSVNKILANILPS